MQNVFYPGCFFIQNVFYPECFCLSKMFFFFISISSSQPLITCVCICLESGHLSSFSIPIPYSEERIFFWKKYFDSDQWIFWLKGKDILEKILARQTADEDVFRGEIEKVKGLEKSRHCLNNIWFLCGAACDYSGDRPAAPHRSFCPNKPGRTNTVNTDSEQIHLPLSVRNRRCPNTADWEIQGSGITNYKCYSVYCLVKPWMEEQIYGTWAMEKFQNPLKGFPVWAPARVRCSDCTGFLISNPYVYFCWFSLYF